MLLRTHAEGGQVDPVLGGDILNSPLGSYLVPLKNLGAM